MSLRSYVAGWCLVATALAGQGTLSAQEVRAAPATRAPAQPAAPAGTQQRGAAPASPLQRVISLDLRRVPLRDALQAIAKQGGVTLIYSNRVVSLDRVVSVELRNGTVQTALDRLQLRLAVDRPLSAKEESAAIAWARGKFGAEFAVTIETRAEVPRSPAGKFEDFVCEVP